LQIIVLFQNKSTPKTRKNTTAPAKAAIAAKPAANTPPDLNPNSFDDNYHAQGISPALQSV